MGGTSFAYARLAVVVVLLFGFFTNPSLSAQVATGVRDDSIGTGSIQREPSIIYTPREARNRRGKESQPRPVP